jgi:hypothetical protein
VGVINSEERILKDKIIEILEKNIIWEQAFNCNCDIEKIAVEILETTNDSKPIVPYNLSHKIWAIIDARRETGLERQIYYENIVDQVDELINLVDTYGIK